MIPLPTPYTLGVKRRVAGATDDWGNPVVSFEDAVDWPVFGFASGANAEPGEPARDLSNVLWTVYAPAGDKLPGTLDLVVLGGVDFAVDGEPRDYSHDPWQLNVGQAVVYLKRPEG